MIPLPRWPSRGTARTCSPSRQTVRSRPLVPCCRAAPTINTTIADSFSEPTTDPHVGGNTLSVASLALRPDLGSTFPFCCFFLSPSDWLLTDGPTRPLFRNSLNIQRKTRVAGSHGLHQKHRTEDKGDQICNIGNQNQSVRRCLGKDQTRSPPGGSGPRLRASVLTQRVDSIAEQAAVG